MTPLQHLRVRVNRDIRRLENLELSAFAVEASASQVVGSFAAVDESAPPVYKQVHQEQIAAEPVSIERTQQCADCTCRKLR